jgi:hypothetical protein
MNDKLILRGDRGGTAQRLQKEGLRRCGSPQVLLFLFEALVLLYSHITELLLVTGVNSTPLSDPCHPNSKCVAVLRRLCGPRGHTYTTKVLLCAEKVARLGVAVMQSAGRGTRAAELPSAANANFCVGDQSFQR